MIDHQFSDKDQHLTYFFELVQACSSSHPIQS
jgi:hypothetical protein